MSANVTGHATPSHLVSSTEHASWMVVVAAEMLASRQDDPVERGRYAEAARRMRSAARHSWSDPRALLAASPRFINPEDGRLHPIVEEITRFAEDTASGVQAAELCFVAFEWRHSA